MASSSSSSSNTGNNAWGEHVAALEAEVEGLRRLLRAEQVKEAAAQDTGGVGKCRLCAMRELDSARMKSSLERMQAILGELGALGSRHNELVVDEHKASTSQQQEQKQRNQPQQQGDRAADEFPSAADFRAMIARYRNANVLLLWAHLEKTVPHQRCRSYLEEVTMSIFDKLARRMQWQRVKVLFFSPERDFAAWLQRHKATLYTNDEFGQQIISEIAQAQKLSKEMEAFCIQIYKESKVMVLWDPPLEYEFNCVSSDSGSTVELVLPAIVESRTRNLFFPQLVLRSEEVHHGSTTVQQHVQAVPSSAGYQPPQKIPRTDPHPSQATPGKESTPKSV